MNLKYNIPAILYTGLIFFLSSIQQSSIPPVRLFGFDKIVHLIEYLIYGLTLMLAYSNSKSKKIVNNAFSISLITGILYAVSDEIHQFFVPGRDMSIFDLSADVLGVFFGLFIFNKIVQYKTNSKDMHYQNVTHK
ncbi:MAG: VanZ family protein, partial [Candidatus Marinimicrobia bacterium]|nr:VanZ family protein [Candidatus Neomarinimicrobiota bacterium]